jgi:glycosyltransferase involved in cell wall biosynthesis
MTSASERLAADRSLIGVDASRSFVPQPTGTELYSRYLIDALLACAPDRYSFRLYFNQPPAHSAFRTPHSTFKSIPFPRLWTHLRLSTEMVLHAPDLLFVPAHVLPIIHPRRSVVTVHDLGYLHFPEAHPPRQRWYLDRSTRWHARTAAHLLADSEATRRDLIERYHARPDRITVAYPGLDLSVRQVDDPDEIARVKAKYHIDGDYLLYLGTIQPRKNLQRLIVAFASCELPHVLVLAGRRGWYADDLLKQANDRVKIIGYVDAADKNALLSGATAFVFPSLYEGFGFPVLEAMACSVPVLCSNTSALPEVAGQAARLVNPLDADDIARGLREVALNENVRGALIRRGQQRAQGFTWQACAKTTLHVFKQVLDDGIL